MDPIYKLLKTIQEIPDMNYDALSINCKLTQSKFEKAFSESINCQYIGRKKGGIVYLTDDGIDYIKNIEDEKYRYEMFLKTSIEANKAIKKSTYINIVFGITNLIFAIINLYLFFCCIF